MRQGGVVKYDFVGRVLAHGTPKQGETLKALQEFGAKIQKVVVSEHVSSSK